MIIIRHLQNHTKSVLTTFTHVFTFLNDTWYKLGEDPYLIKIRKLYTTENINDLVVEFQVSNRRAIGKLPLSEFMVSPLIHAVHPSQIYQLGFDRAQLLLNTQLKDSARKKAKPRSKNIFKRIFYEE